MIEFTITEPMFPTKKVKVKKSLDDLLFSKEVVTGKEVIHNLKELEKQEKQFEDSVEDELRNRIVK